MSCYVDDAMIPYRPPHRKNVIYKMSHLFCDSMLELNTWADALHLRMAWLQTPQKGGWYHFDVSMKVRETALMMGAVPISYRRDLSRMVAERAWLKGVIAKVE